MNRAELEIKGAEALLVLLDIPRVLASPSLGMALRNRAEVVIDAVEDDIRADERAKIASWLRETYHEQNSWLWYELGESALERVAAYIERGELS